MFESELKHNCIETDGSSPSFSGLHTNRNRTDPIRFRFQVGGIRTDQFWPPLGKMEISGLKPRTTLYNELLEKVIRIQILFVVLYLKYIAYIYIWLKDRYFNSFTHILDNQRWQQGRVNLSPLSPCPALGWKFPPGGE